MVGINNIYTSNPLHTIVDSGSVSVSNLPETQIVNFTLSLLIANPSLTQTAVFVKITPGSLFNIFISGYDNMGTSYVRIYSTASIPTVGVTAILATFPVLHGTRISIPFNNMAFSTGLWIRE